MQHDVFISYTQPDRTMAFRIHELFQAQGLASWIAVSKSNGIAAGQGFEAEIVTAIAASKVFVLVYSDYCNRSENIIRELRQRWNGQPTVILRLDASPFEKGLSYYLTGLQHIAVSRDDTKDGLRQLLTAVTGHVRGHASTGSASTDKMLFSTGMKLLRQKKYPEAANTLRQHMEIAPDDAQSHFYWALAVIGGRKTRQLDGLVVKKLLQALEPFLRDRNAAFINVLLAILKQGYYALNGFKVPSPVIEELLQGVVLDGEKAAGILTHLDEPENNVWRQVAYQFANYKNA
jgi:hypothetical protein